MGNDDEVELADRLREVRSALVPPSRTNLDAVISRGRRRLALQRAGGVLGVVAVVGGISFAALALRGVGGGGGAQIPPAAAPVTTATTSPGQPAQDWNSVPMSPSPGGGCKEVPTMPPAAGLKPDARAIAAFVEGLRGSAGQGRIGDPVVVTQQENPSSVEVFAEVSDADGIGSVHMSWNSQVGDPLAAANKNADRRGGCDALFRTVRPSGAVLQLRAKMLVPALPTPTSQTPTSQTATSQTATSQTATSQTATSQTATSQTTAGRFVRPFVEATPELAIYLPDTGVYRLTESRYGWASSKVSSTVPPYTAARKTLPLTDRQLQAAAEDFVARLGF